MSNPVLPFFGHQAAIPALQCLTKASRLYSEEVNKVPPEMRLAFQTFSFGPKLSCAGLVHEHSAIKCQVFLNCTGPLI